jgi:hypothetical protein
MVRSTFKVEECCSHCQQPVRHCRHASCDDAPTYAGVLLRGRWEELQTEATPREASTASA